MSTKPDVTNPKVFGPVIWYMLHKAALTAKTADEKTRFIAYFTITINNLPCMTCREHAQEYVRTHPIADYWIRAHPQYGDIGMYLYTYDFHNDVTKRLNEEAKPGQPKKTIPDFESTIAGYLSLESVCTKTCGAEDENEEAAPRTIVGSKFD